MHKRAAWKAVRHHLAYLQPVIRQWALRRHPRTRHATWSGLQGDRLDPPETKPGKHDRPLVKRELLVWRRRAALDVELENGSRADEVDSDRQEFRIMKSRVRVPLVEQTI